MSGAVPPSPSPAAPLYAQPSDVTLVKDFLRRWVTSGDTKAGGEGAYLHAADVYSSDPEELARRFRPAVSLDGDRTWYFLSPLRNKSPRDRRKVRAVAGGTGCWHSEAGPKNVVDHLDGGRHVGYRQSFSFMRRGAAGRDSRTGWIMAEFHLHHDSDGVGRKVEGLVLCKMYRSPRNRGPAPVATDGDDDLGSGVSLSTETATPFPRRKTYEEDSNAVTPRRQWHSKNSDGADMATAMTAPLLTKKALGDDEVSGTTTAAVAADDDDLLASLPARKKIRVAMANAESSGAALALKEKADGALAAASHLHCPQCGFHLAAMQALVTLTKSKLAVPNSEISRRQRMTPSHGSRTENMHTRFS